MMKLYYSKGACSLAVRIIIHELEINAEFESVNLKTKMTESGENFLTINAKGAVPTLVLETDEVLTENAAIDQYLADQFPTHRLLPPMGQLNRYKTLEWLSYMSSDIHKSFGPLFSPNVPDEIKKDIFIPLLKTKLSYVDEQLAGKKYLMGDTFTLPDAYFFVMLRWLKAFQIDLAEFTHLKTFFDTMKTRSSVTQALEEEGLS